MKSSTWIAIGLFVAAAAWLASGLVLGGGEEEEETPSAAAPQPTLVGVRPSVAELVPQYIFAQGVAQPYRAADVISSTTGTLEDVEVRQGDVVEAGAVLAQIRLEARESQLRSARSRVESLEADLEAISGLESQGFATQSRVRELQAQLEEARAALEGVLSDIRDATIEAPIPGIVSDVFVNSGETVPSGSSIVRIVDNAPLRVTLDISQRDVGSVDVGREAVVSFATGALANGRVCFVAPSADPETRTFRVEIRVPNTDRKIPSVVSTEVRFQSGEAQAHFISPAILALSEAGSLGIKSVDADNVVRFHTVQMVRAEADGIWVAGLPEELQIITIGQGFVREGERVRIERVRDAEEGTSAEVAGSAPLPTATVEEGEFEGAEDLAEPPPAEELCRGAAANVIATSAIPSSSGAADADSGTATQTQPGGGTTGAQQAPETESDPAAQTGPAASPSIEPISPSIPSPPVEQPPPQLPGGSGGPQGQGATGSGAIGGPGAGAGGGAVPAPSGEAGP